MATAAAKRLCHGAAPRRAVASAWNACGHGVRHHSTSGEELGMRAPPPSLKGRHLSSVYSLRCVARAARATSCHAQLRNCLWRIARNAPSDLWGILAGSAFRRYAGPLQT